jgi:hypothetical protein
VIVSSTIFFSLAEDSHQMTLVGNGFAEGSVS